MQREKLSCREINVTLFSITCASRMTLRIGGQNNSNSCECSSSFPQSFRGVVCFRDALWEKKNQTSIFQSTLLMLHPSALIFVFLCFIFWYWNAWNVIIIYILQLTGRWHSNFIKDSFQAENKMSKVLAALLVTPLASTQWRERRSVHHLGWDWSVFWTCVVNVAQGMNQTGSFLGRGKNVCEP